MLMTMQQVPDYLNFKINALYHSTCGKKILLSAKISFESRNLSVPLTSSSMGLYKTKLKVVHGSSQVVYSKNALSNNCQKRFWSGPFCFQSSFEFNLRCINFSECSSSTFKLDSHDRCIPFNDCVGVASQSSGQIIAEKGNSNVSGIPCTNKDIQSSWSCCATLNVNWNMNMLILPT